MATPPARPAIDKTAHDKLVESLRSQIRAKDKENMDYLNQLNTANSKIASMSDQIELAVVQKENEMRNEFSRREEEAFNRGLASMENSIKIAKSLMI